MTEQSDAAGPRELMIGRLGAHGDGIAELEGGALFVPYALAGERVLAAVEGDRARILEILASSPERVAPACRHFTHCGGCATQHMARASEQAWKTSLVINAFSQQRLDIAPEPMIVAAGASRRRATFAARRTKTGAILGFHAPRAHDIVDLDQCPILAPEIESRMPALRLLIAPLLSRSGEARLTVTLTDTGVDVAIEGAKPKLSTDERLAVSGLARAAGVIRVALATDVVFQSTEPRLMFGKASVVPAPGVFLQAVAGIERQMGDLIMEAAGKTKRAADLFAGAGTFSFRLADRAEVLAVDGDGAAIAALADAARRTQGIKAVTAKVRDLFREPLSAKELETFDCVVFDPPRAGASAQAAMIAKSKVRTVIAVSCAPSTLARDCKTLIEGGYRLETVTPIDQFVYSPHIEAIAVLRRPKN